MCIGCAGGGVGEWRKSISGWVYLAFFGSSGGKSYGPSGGLISESSW